jgi:hypothetical protein
VIQEHPADARQVLGRREHPRVARHAAEQPGARVVHLAAQHAALPVLGRRDSRSDPRGGPERRVAKPERTDEHTVEIPVERLAGHAAHDLAQEDEAGVAVLEAGAGRIVELHLRDRARRAREPALDRLVRRVSGESGAVRQHAPDGDLVERPRAKFLQVSAQRRVELHAALLDEHHDGDRRAERLRERGDVEHGVRRHRVRLGHERAPAVGTVIEHLVAASDEHHDAGDLTGGDGVSRGGVDGREIRRLGAGGERSDHEEE